MNKERELKEALRAALDYIDAIPKDAASRFPGMPGFDRDEVEALFLDDIGTRDGSVFIPEHNFDYLLNQMEGLFEDQGDHGIKFCKARIAFRTLCGWSPKRIEQELNKEESCRPE